MGVRWHAKPDTRVRFPLPAPLFLKGVKALPRDPEMPPIPEERPKPDTGGGDNDR